MNPLIGRFEGKAKWNRRAIALHFSKGANDGIDEALATAEALWSDQAAWNRRVQDFAVERLLPVKNDSWLDDGEAEVTPKGFKARMRLVSITVHPGGRFDFWHDDGDLFCGHLIEVSGNLRDGLTDADIPG